MAEKRKLPARERREPAAKRRVSEAAPQTPSQPQSSSSRKKASTPGIASNAASTPSLLPPEPPVDVTPLPTKIKDGEGLPTVAMPQQSLSLSDKEYQSIAESAVLLASLERSKRKWLSDGILVRYWTKPKKTKRDQIEGKNPPKESMSKVGPCAIMVGPHLFDAMLYTVKDPNAPPPIQYTPPQRPMVHYGHPNNFQQYHPYPHPPPPLPQTMPPHQQPQSVRQPPPPAHPGPPQPGYQPKNHNQPMRPPPQHGGASGQASPNPPHPPPTGPQQRPSPSQPAQPQPPKPSPDPVIQMLATRAASDPELKALMRVVASTEATQEQLRAFQSHIDELNAIIRAREQRQQQRQQPAAPPPPQQNPPQPPPSQQKPPEPQSNPAQARSQSQSQQLPRVEVQLPRYSPSGNPPQTPSQQPASQAQTPNTTPQVKQEPNAATPSQAPAPTPSGPNASITPGPPPAPAPHPNSKQPSPAVRPMPHPPPPPQSAGPRPGPPYPPYQQPPYQGQPPPIHSRPPQYGSPVPYYRPAPPPPPPRLNYKSVVLEFTSPLTPYGSSTSGHAGSGDRYLFPENTILEWLPGGTTVLASFLLVRKVDPNAPFPIETASDLANSRAKSKSSKSKKKKTADEKKEDEKAKDKNTQPAPSPSNPDPSSNAALESKPTDPTEGEKPSNAQDDKKDQPDTKVDPAKENPEDTKTKEPNLKEYYQPITFHIQAPNPKVLEPLARVVKSPDEVRKYMNEIMDRAERAPDGFLAYRLPREEAQQDEKRENEDHGKKSGTGTPVPALNTTARNRPSRGSKAVVEQEDMVDTDVDAGLVEDVEEEEELKDFYGPPTGIGFW